MRLLFYSLLTLLPFLGLSLNASTCKCLQTEHATAGIEAVPCCQESPADCCIQQNRASEPLQPIVTVVPQADSLDVTLSVVATLPQELELIPPHCSTHDTRARSPPLRSSEQRCYLQSWLI